MDKWTGTVTQGQRFIHGHHFYRAYRVRKHWLVFANPAALWEALVCLCLRCPPQHLLLTAATHSLSHTWYYTNVKTDFTKSFMFFWTASCAFPDIWLFMLLIWNRSIWANICDHSPTCVPIEGVKNRKCVTGIRVFTQRRVLVSFSILFGFCVLLCIVVCTLRHYTSFYICSRVHFDNICN